MSMAAGDSADSVRRRGRGAQVLAAAAVPPLERQPARGRPGERGGGRAHRLPADGKVVDVEDLGRDRGEVGPRCGGVGVGSIGGRGGGGRWHQVDEPRQLRRVRNVDLPRGRSCRDRRRSWRGRGETATVEIIGRSGRGAGRPPAPSAPPSAAPVASAAAAQVTPGAPRSPRRAARRWHGSTASCLSRAGAAACLAEGEGHAIHSQRAPSASNASLQVARSPTISPDLARTSHTATVTA